MLTPLIQLFFLDRQLRAFHKEAFGHLRKAAANMRFSSWAIFLYYAGVLLGSLWVGDLQAMFTWPLEKEGIQIFVRIGAAIVAFGLWQSVATQLYLVIKAPSTPVNKIASDDA